MPGTSPHADQPEYPPHDSGTVSSEDQLEVVGRRSIHQKNHNGTPKLPWFRLNNPSIQIILASLSLFFDPGLYQALIFFGAGGGRPSSTSMANISNGIVYGVVVLCGPFTGAFLNTVGPRWTMMLGTTGYPIFQGAMWYFDVYGRIWFPIFDGVYLGVTGTLVWTTAIFTVTAYSEEETQGRWRSVQWGIYTTGSTVGAALAIGISWNATSEGVPHAVYIVFIVLQVFSLGIALLLLDPKVLRRGDGTPITVSERPTIRDSLKIGGEQFLDWRILLMLPCIFSTEMFFPLQTSINAYAFNLRTRVLNSLLNSLIQIATSLIIGLVLDNKRLGCARRRAMCGITLCVVWITTADIAQSVWLAFWNFDRSVPGPMIDCTDSSYAAAVAVYLLYAGQYGLSPSLMIWVVSTLSNDTRKKAAISGIYFGVLSAGAAVSFGVDATVQPYLNENGAYFGLSTLSWPILYFVAWKCLTDTNASIDRGDAASAYSDRGHELGDVDRRNLNCT